MKQKAFRDRETGQIVHIGDWDYQIEVSRAPELDARGRATGKMLRTEKQRNPKPDRFEEVMVEVVTGADEGLYAKDDHVALRRVAYPSIADQLDALWKGGAAMKAMRARVLGVKAKHPKAKKPKKVKA